jgi:hypothetical protein
MAAPISATEIRALFHAAHISCTRFTDQYGFAMASTPVALVILVATVSPYLTPALGI